MPFVRPRQLALQLEKCPPFSQSTPFPSTTPLHLFRADSARRGAIVNKPFFNLSLWLSHGAHDARPPSPQRPPGPPYHIPRTQHTDGRSFKRVLPRGTAQRRQDDCDVSGWRSGIRRRREPRDRLLGQWIDMDMGQLDQKRTLMIHTLCNGHDYMDSYHDHVSLRSLTADSLPRGFQLMPDAPLQIQDPTNTYLVSNKAVSSGDHSFDARNDGKHIYCFSNEAWSASTKEVSFNVHGIVYVPENEAPSDPLELEGTYDSFLRAIHALNSTA